MYLNDMNCGAGSEYGKLSVSQADNTATATPKTPEIINSIIAITNPFEYVRRGSSTGEDKILSPSEYASADTCSSASSNIGSPTSPPRVQSMCSQLIKEELKLTLQKKRQNTLSCSENDSNASTPVHSIGAIADKFANRHDESSFDDEDDCSMNGDFGGNFCGLTPEDEERRKRRRERNKIAATKCRQKKREKTNHLVHESEELEDQNQKLRSQIQQLEVQKQSLMGMLTQHKPTCMKPSPEQSPIVDYQQPPLFSNSTDYQPPAQFVRNDENKLNDQRSALVCQETTVIPDLRHLNTLDFQDAFLNSPSVLLNTNENQYNDYFKNKYHNNYKNDRSLPIRHLSLNTNYKNNVAAQLQNYNFLDEPMNQDDNFFTHNMIENPGNGCIA